MNSSNNTELMLNCPFSTADIKATGLTLQEYQRILEHLGRHPSHTELGIFSAMWSEHCSYKSSRHWLKMLPSTGDVVISGPGENAGIVDIGDGQAIVFKIESHNHPSFIEPYHGAATGVGGIMRDIFTMGARPIANLNALRFGQADHKKTAWLFKGVVSGIGGYGNCVGVPTVGGEIEFNSCYNGNILVNAMCVGLVKTDKIFKSAAKGAGHTILYAGSHTGRDGIHGATMASASFDGSVDDLKPTVQVGDPFMEKKLLEACLELMQHDSIIAIQDMGAAGLTSSSVEMAHKGNSGMELNLDNLPCRHPDMSAYEIMLSESQERMLIVLKSGSEEKAKEIFDKWEVKTAIIGTTTQTGRLVITHRNEIVADLPVLPLADDAPLYIRKTKPAEEKSTPLPVSYNTQWQYSLQQILLKMLRHPNLCTRRAAYEQYDSTVMANTMRKSGGDAAIIQIDEGPKAIAICCDSQPRFCHKNPYEGGKISIAECWRNLITCGAKPLAFTNCLNFGNPENPTVMHSFVEIIRGMKDAALALDFPVVSGNVSLYNETDGISINPTPTIGGVGLINDNTKIAHNHFMHEDQIIALIGTPPVRLGQSHYCDIIHHNIMGDTPTINLEDERNNGDFIRKLIHDNLCNSVHDVSDGGLAIALAEMCMPNLIGAKIELPDTYRTPSFLFAEDPSRYIISFSSDDQAAITSLAQKQNIPLLILGVTTGTTLHIHDLCDIKCDKLREAHDNPEYSFLTPLNPFKAPL